MSLKDKVNRLDKVNGREYDHKKIITVFEESFSKTDDKSIVVQYRLLLNLPRSSERVRISMGGARRDVVEIIGDCILIKERRAYHVLMQDEKINKMLKYLKSNNRLNGI